MPKTPKRKRNAAADDDDDGGDEDHTNNNIAEEPAAMSKKEKRALALQRAKDSMAADRKRVQARLSSKNTPSKGSSVVAAAKTEEEGLEETEARPKKRSRKSQPSTATATAALSSPPVSSKKKAREEAVRRAKEYGAKDKQALQGKKATSSEKKPKPSAAKKQTAAKCIPHVAVPAVAAAAAMPIAPMAVVQARVAGQLPMTGFTPIVGGPQGAGQVNPQLMAQFMMRQQPNQPAAAMAAAAADGFGAGTMPYNHAAAMMGYATVNPYTVAQQQTGLEGDYQYPPPAATAATMKALRAQQGRVQANWHIQQKQQHAATNAVAAPISFVPATAKTSGDTKSVKKTPSKRSPIRRFQPPPKDDNDEDDNDDDDIPPPPIAKLEMQISQQVLANANASMNNQPSPFTQPPPEAFTTTSAYVDEPEEPFEDDDQPIVVDDAPDAYTSINAAFKPPPKARSWTSMLGALLAITVGILAWQAEERGGSITAQFLKHSATCFLDSKTQYEGGQIVVPCENSSTAQPCPEHGICSDGALLRCPHRAYQVNGPGQFCELTSTVMEAVAALADVLGGLSIQALCNGGGPQRDVGLPLFDYQELQLAHPTSLAMHSLDHVVLGDKFVFETDKGRTYVGLQDDYSLSLPIWCRLQQVFKAGLSELGTLCVALLQWLSSLAWATLSAYPLISLIGLAVILIVQKGRSFQKKQKQLVLDVANVRDQVIGILQDDANASHAALHIRDELVSELTAGDPTARQRPYYIIEVWPRVVPQLHQDNRIKKTQRVSSGGGKPRDHWQWVASIKKKKKRVVMMTDDDHQ